MKNDSQFEFNEFNEQRQSMFNALATQAFEQSQIETDFNELHAMYPFLPVSPPIDKSSCVVVGTTAVNVEVPTHCKIMRFSNGGGISCFWSAGGGNGFVENSNGRGWVAIPAGVITPWFYCGNLLQIALCSRSSFSVISVEFASVHARKRG